MGTQTDGLEKVDAFKLMVIFGIYVRFLGCIYIYVCICTFTYDMYDMYQKIGQTKEVLYQDKKHLASVR